MDAEGDRTLTVLALERMPYREAYELQVSLRDRCLESRGRQNFLMLLEHPPVITIGRSGEGTEVLAPGHELTERGIEVVETNRGGRVTYHGPGQLVMYPIIDLSVRGRDLHRYLRDLEGWLIRLCRSFGIDADAERGRTGVWVSGKKIASIGIAVRRWVSYHGVALNVTTDLSRFGLIVPCGFTDRAVTSMAAELGRAPALEEVARRAAGLFSSYFDFHRVQHRKCAHMLAHKPA